MLLSSVSLVAKPKNGKNKDVTEKKANRRINNDLQNESEVNCEQCKKEIDEENAIFKFPSSVPDEQNQDQKLNSCHGERVTIATGDALCLSVERFYYTIVLCEETKSDTTCIFRKKVLETKSMPNGHVETVVFALDCDRDFFLTASIRGDLELNYNTSIPRADEPDERIFDVYFTNLGHVLIQPKLRTNTYLHHIDQALSVQQLDLNWRCPEEYFFHFNAVPEYPERKTPKNRHVCTHFKVAKDNTNESCPTSEMNSANTAKAFDIHANNKETVKEMSDKLLIELPTKRSMKRKNKLSTLFLGCFSGRSQRISMS